MNYDRLRNILKANNLSLEKACNKIDKSTSWFYAAAQNDTITVKDLDKLLSLCNLTLAQFFSETTSTVNNVANEPPVKYGNNETMELLRENRKLRLRIEELEGK